MLVYGKSEYFVMQMMYIYVLCASGGNSHAAFCTTCSLLMLVEDTRGDHIVEEYSRVGLMAAL